MLKNLIAYRIASSFTPDLATLEEALQTTPFIPIGATQETTTGWVPPRGEEHGALAESVNGQWMLKFKSESKSIPASVMNRKLQERADAIEQEFGRKPGKKEKRDLKEEIKLDLLPLAFPKEATTWVWIDPQAMCLYIDTSAQSRADVIVSLLVESLQGLGVALIDTQTSAQAAMAHWLLTQEAPVGFSIDRHCKLKAADESKATVNYSRHPLDTDEIKAHVEHGKLPIELAMTWDDRVSFVLTEGLQIKKIEFLDVTADSKGDESGFDTDATIATAELAKMIPDLIEALGGEGRTEIAGAQASATGGTLAEKIALNLQAKGMTVTVSHGNRTVTVDGGAVTGQHQAPADTDSASAPFDA